MTNTTRRVLLIGTDGLRPDQFDPELMPTYAALMARGTKLAAHHSIFPSYTRAILSTLGTGCTPGKHGVVTMTLRVDGATPDHIVRTADSDQLAELDRMTGGHAIMKPTLGDLLEQHGLRMGVAGAQTSGGGAIWARHQQIPKLVAATTYGRPENQRIWDQLGGPPPPMDLPTRDPHDLYIARGVRDVLLNDDSLRLIVVWLAEPDFALHKHGLGSPEVREAMRVCDESLAAILDGLDRRGIRDQFDILLISDHGHSSVDQQGTFAEQLQRAKGDLGDRMPALTIADNYLYPEPYAAAPSASDLGPLVAWIQEQPWAGAVFGGTTEIARLPGVLPLTELWNGATNERAPLIAINPAWSDRENGFGVPGTVSALIKHGGNVSTHGSASPYDMHPMAYAIGPDFREGVTTELPSGATDIAPTILSLLGIDPPAWMDGRVLWETMNAAAGEPGDVRDDRVGPAVHHTGGFAPVLHRHHVGATSYVHMVTNGRAQ